MNSLYVFIVFFLFFLAGTPEAQRITKTNILIGVPAAAVSFKFLRANPSYVSFDVLYINKAVNSVFFAKSAFDTPTPTYTPPTKSAPLAPSKLPPPQPSMRLSYATKTDQHPDLYFEAMYMPEHGMAAIVAFIFILGVIAVSVTMMRFRIRCIRRTNDARDKELSEALFMAEQSQMETDSLEAEIAMEKDLANFELEYLKCINALATRKEVLAKEIEQCLSTIEELKSLAAIGSHIRKDLVRVENDAIVQVDATTSLDSSSGRIVHLPNSPVGGIGGTRGIVYKLPPLINCQPVERSEDYIAASYIRIALISDGSDCPIDAKLTQAQFDGAVGAIVYNSSVGTIDPSSILHNRISSLRPSFPVMLVDRNYGETLRLEVDTLEEESQKKSSSHSRAIFVSIYPSEDSEHLSGWEISLITLVIILALCFCTSLFFHVYSGRNGIRDRRSRRVLRDDREPDLSKQIQMLPPCALDRLMLRTVTEEDMKILSECTTPLDNILNPSLRQKNSNSFGTCSCGNVNTESDPACEEQLEQLAKEESRKCSDDCVSGLCSNDRALHGCIATCIVCIDDFVVGSRMRILPCGHNYHIECIDPWLTAKSSLCPLCKYDTRSVLTELERAISGPHILTTHGSFDDIIGNSSLYSSSPEPSSYLAESHVRLTLSGAFEQLKHFAVEKIAAPVSLFAKKMSRKKSAESHQITESCDFRHIDTGTAQYDRQRYHIYPPFEDTNTIPILSTPLPCAAGSGSVPKPEVLEVSRSVEKSSIMVEVKTSDTTSTPNARSEKQSNCSATETQNSSKQREAAAINKIDRVSLGELLHNDGDISDDYFN
ncbi:hypothetical protein BX070DRAFT_249520 [Coemansia spiralis]|nr:hypothetical protein BX070DRAFT_249520 [Coemansia spiralis]